MDKEKIRSHIDQLKEKHDKLDKLIQDAHNHWDSDTSIKDLKIKKLYIKSEIDKLENELNTL